MRKTPQIICIASGKGGVGKTTTAAALGYLFAKDKHKTLLIDADSQVNLTQAMNVEADGRFDIQGAVMSRTAENEIPITNFIKPTQYKGIDIIPGNPFIEGEGFMASIRKAKIDDSLNLWIVAMEAIKNLKKYDIIIMDTHPSSGIITTYPMQACNNILIPLEANERSISGFTIVYREIIKARKTVNPNIKLLGYFFNKVKAQTNSAKEYIPSAMVELPNAIKSMNGGTDEGTCFKTVIRASEDAQKAINYHIAVTAKKSPIANDFKKLYSEILEVIF